MALGKRCSSMKERGASVAVVEVEERFVYGAVRYTRSFGRKRVVISKDEVLAVDSCPATPLKRLCSGGGLLDLAEAAAASVSPSPLESLPQDILVRILCGVDHDDLKQLLTVSKTIRDATLVAKECHFKFSTPRKVRAFRNPISPDEYSSEEIEAPNAPRQRWPFKSRLGGKGLGHLSVALFT